MKRFSPRYPWRCERLWQAFRSHYRMLKRFCDPGYEPPARDQVVWADRVRGLSHTITIRPSAGPVVPRSGGASMIDPDIFAAI
jgi:hypothetical protein